MAYAIEYFFDPRLESRIRRLCGQIRGTNHGGTVLIEDVKARPHLTLAICDDVDEARMNEVLQEIANNSPSLPVMLASLGMFPGEQSVLFLAPVMSDELLQGHRDLHARMSEFTDSQWKLYTPNRWVPHCTLAMHLPKEGLRKVTDIIMESVFPLSGELVELGVSEFEEGAVRRYVCSYALQ